MKQLRNRQLLSIDKIANKYILKVSILRSYIEDWEQFYFALITTTNEELTFQEKKIKQSGDFNIYEIEIDYSKEPLFYSQGEEVGFSIVRRRGDEKQRGKIKSNIDYLEQQQIKISDKYVFYPSTTVNGNINFCFRENFLLATCEHIMLREKGILQLSGFYHWNELEDVENKQVYLTWQAKSNEEPIHVPVQSMSIPESYTSYRWYEEVKNQGYTVMVNLFDYMDVGSANNFKFYLTVNYEESNVVKTIESDYLIVSHAINRVPIKQKVSLQDKRIQVSVEAKRKTECLAVDVYEYKFALEFMRSVKRRWVVLRRSKQLLQLYKLAFFTLGKVLPTKKDLVIFESFHGKQYSDSPRAIYEYLEKHAPNYE